MRPDNDRGTGGAPRPEPHDVLGIGPGATAEEINAAYRRALRRQHPDTRGPARGPRGGEAARRDPSMADLQAARAELLRKAHAQATPERSAAPTPDPPSHIPEPWSRARQMPPRRRAWTPGWPLGSDTPDLRVGPVRYHGPASPRRSP